MSRQPRPVLPGPGAAAREDILHELTDTMHQCIYVSDAVSRTLYVSRAYEEIWGRSRESCMAKPRAWMEALHPDDRAKVEKYFADKTLNRFEVQYRILRPDGTIRWVLDRSFRMRDIRGRLNRVIGIAEDITDRKGEMDRLMRSRDELERAVQERTAALNKTNEELRRHQIEQQVLLDMIPALVWFKDVDNQIVCANRAAAESVGLRVEDVVGKSTYDIYPEEAKNYHQDDLDVIRSGKPKLGIVERLSARAGEKRWIQTDKVPYFDDEGKPIGVVVFAQDITDRKEEEDRMQDLARGLGSIIEMADELILCADMDTFYRRSVELARERLGVERCSIFTFDEKIAHGTYGTNMRRETTDERRNSFVIVPEWEEHFAKISPQKSRWVCKQGADRWNWNGRYSRVIGRGWVSYTAIARAGKRAIALFIHDAEITKGPFDPIRQELVAVYCSLLAEIIEQKRSEEILRESEKKFRSLADTIEASIFVFQGPRLVYVNPAASRISGYSLEELRRMHFWELIHPDFRDLVKRRGLARQRGEYVPPRYEVKILTRQGETRWVDYASKIVDYDGKPAALGVAFDITDRKRAEERLFMRMESEQLAARVATELGNTADGTTESRANRAIAQIAKFLNAEIAALMLFSEDSESLTDLFKVRSKRVPSIQRLLRGVSRERIRKAATPLLRGEVVKVGNVAELPKSASFARDICARAGIVSFVAIPVLRKGRVAGGVVVGCVRERAWSAEDSTFLKLMGEIMSNALHRDRLEEEHARLAKKVLELQEDERKNLSDVLHDDLGQLLTLTALELSDVKAVDEKSAQFVSRSITRTHSVLSAVRNLAGSLRPPMLDDLGIGMGLHTLCREFNHPEGLRVECHVPHTGVALDEAQRTCVYRVVQEALTNAARHARATRVKVTMTTTDKDAIIEVQDNGRGFDLHALTRRRGTGLIGMKERMNSCGGTIDIQSRPGAGTRIRATVPLPDRPKRSRVGRILRKNR